MKSVTRALPDLSIEQQMTAIGAQNSDGSVLAQSVKIRPDMPTKESSSTPIVK